MWSRSDGFEWHYVAAILGIAVLAMLAFQAADIYQVQAFRGYEKQYFAARLRLVGRVPDRDRASLLRQARRSCSRASGSAASTSSASSRSSASARALFLLVRRWTREGRSTAAPSSSAAATAGEHLINALARRGFRRPRRRRVRRSRRRPRADRRVAGRQKLGTVDDLVEFARRTRIDLVIFSLPISAEGRILQMLKKLWVLPVDIRLVARIPTSCVSGRAPIPISATSRCSTSSTSRSPTGTW